MATAVNKNYTNVTNEYDGEKCNLVLAGLQQVAEGNTKDFNTVCIRLEKKYLDEAIQN